MRTRIQKWGNSLALRIPKSFAAEVHLDQDAWVDISLAGDKLIISPERDDTLTLEQLLTRLNGANVAQGKIRDSSELWLRPGQRVQVIQYEDRIELIPVRPAREARGFLKGIDTTVEREPDRL